MRTRPLSRRDLVKATAALGLASLLPVAPVRAAAAAAISFDELYGTVGVLGMSFSDKTTALAGQGVAMRGFMAPPLKAEAKFFVLTEIPMSLCPFCSSDADWPANIVVVYLDETQTFVQANRPIEAAGRLEVGSWRDPETGFVSLLRIVDARFSTV